MCKKKLMTAILVTTMVMGSTLTAFAADTDKTGSTSGSGSSEGHVEKEVESMILPTVPTDNTKSPFKYTMDPERLIQETGGKKHEGIKLPAEASDTGVYFQVSENEYANTSSTLQAINNGSCNVTLTVTAKATASAGGNDITLATSATPSTSSAELYLGLKVGKKDAPTVLKADAQTITKTIEGTSGNFEVTVDDQGKYVYQQKADATTWKAIEMNLTGAVSDAAITDDTTAPTVDVTWSYAKAADGAAVDTDDQVDYTEAPADRAPSIAVTAYDYDRTATFDIVTDFGAGDLAATSIKSVKIGADGQTFATDLTSSCVISGNKITFPSGKLGTAAVGDKKYVQVTFDDDTAVVLTLTVAK